MARCILLLLLLAAAGAIIGHHRGWRERIADARITLFGWPTERLYRQAEREYQAADFERAELTCRKVLARDPNHAPARALLMEVEFLLGKGKAASPLDYSPHVTTSRFISAQILLEIENALVRADRLMHDGDREAAGRELRKILEYAKWLPDGAELQRKTDGARSGIALLESEFHSAPPR